MDATRFVRILITLLLAASIAAGCTGGQPAPAAATRVPLPAGPAQPSATISLPSTATPPPASPTATPPPSATPSPTLTFTPTPSPFPTLEPGLEAHDYLKQAGQLADSGEVDPARLAIDQAIRLEPLALEPYYQRAQLLASWKSLQAAAANKQAISKASEALKQNPHDAALYLQRGQARIALAALTGQPQKRSRVTKLPEIWKIEGGLTASNLALTEALDDLEQAIQLAPNSAEAYHQRGLARHLQALFYTDRVLVKSDSQQLQQAIADYRKAVQLDPSLAAAWNDLGAALLHLHPELAYTFEAPAPGAALNKTQSDARAALEALGKAILLQPDQAQVHLNRALAYFLLLTNKLPDAAGFSGGKASEESGSEALDGLQAWWADANRARELDPDSADAVMLRYVAEVILEMLDKDTAKQAEYRDYRSQDEQAIQALTGKPVDQVNLPGAVTSAGMPALSPAGLRLQGKLERGVYTSPDKTWSVKLPRLDDTGSVVWDAQSPLGQQAVYIGDNIGRYYQLFVLPPGDDMALQLALLQQVVKDNPVDKELSFTVGKSMQGQGFLYYDRENQAQCAAAVLPGAKRQVAAVYCLLDQAPDIAGAGVVRSSTKIPYEPVEKLLENFINDWKVLP